MPIKALSAFIITILILSATISYKLLIILYDNIVIILEKDITTINDNIIFFQLLNIISILYFFSIKENPIENHIKKPIIQKQIAYPISFIKSPYSLFCITSISPISSDLNFNSSSNEFNVSNCCNTYSISTPSFCAVM